MEPTFYQENPFFPDLLNQPDFLVVPELGRLVAVYVYMPREELSWRNSLAAVEDLFEIKQSTGESTIAVAVLVPPARLEEQGMMFVDQIRNMFDGFAIYDERSHGVAKDAITEIVASARAREGLFRLWRLEHQRVAQNLIRFSEKRYAPFAHERAVQRAEKPQVLRDLKAFLHHETNLRIHERYTVRSPKEPLAGLPERNRFQFDLGVQILNADLRYRLIQHSSPDAALIELRGKAPMR